MSGKLRFVCSGDMGLASVEGMKVQFTGEGQWLEKTGEFRDLPWGVCVEFQVLLLSGRKSVRGQGEVRLGQISCHQRGA